MSTYVPIASLIYQTKKNYRDHLFDLGLNFKGIFVAQKCNGTINQRLNLKRCEGDFMFSLKFVSIGTRLVVYLCHEQL